MTFWVEFSDILLKKKNYSQIKDSHYYFFLKLGKKMIFWKYAKINNFIFKFCFKIYVKIREQQLF
jgi:hypothetical protein